MDVEAWLAEQFRAKAKATSIARRLSRCVDSMRCRCSSDDPLGSDGKNSRPEAAATAAEKSSENQVETLLDAPNVETALACAIAQC
jgi:hypothetical protein